MQQHPRQGITVALAAREYADGLEDIVFGEQEATQQAAQLGHGFLRRDIRKVVEHSSLGVELLVLVLREIIGLDVVPMMQRASGERLDASQQLNERRFAGAVYADQRDAVST